MQDATRTSNLARIWNCRDDVTAVAECVVPTLEYQAGRFRAPWESFGSTARDQLKFSTQVRAFWSKQPVM